ncbi:Hypothetical Protein RradSPS_0271 [Rubrobacter radiotolerans]|uniref:Uncharacterized protein n=1 Tax=Rubrobacter radiotolerans TaxID=42256 RepID=A0A023X0K5_RUBRA|nr:hypothetical protein [Rubrobacter radiotolerans]AHY45554.1 Hypothetical Protein RradSPS_0271 [Rubrobacter radiotolerans]MDX5892967.1 hypothetical protein [Rubrobacter radiotolerans]SMC02828.1 hypothetical protein SAMN00767673_0272 [Rubrobacter radiotolerans DSM 5868]
MAEGLLQTARAVREAALATEGVFDLGRGRFVEAATYEGGEKVSGVVVDDDSVEVHIVLNYPLPKPLPELDRELKERLAPASGGRRTTLVFEDVVDEEERAALRAEARRAESRSETQGSRENQSDRNDQI